MVTVSLCNANLEFLKKICLDMAANFEDKLVESFSNQSKTTAGILHENHKVLNADFQEMIDKSLIRDDEKNETLWCRVTSLESAIRDADEKSALTEEKVNKMSFTFSSFEEKVNKMSFTLDHQVNALA